MPAKQPKMIEQPVDTFDVRLGGGPEIAPIVITRDELLAQQLVSLLRDNAQQLFQAAGKASYRKVVRTELVPEAELEDQPVAGTPPRRRAAAPDS